MAKAGSRLSPEHRAKVIKTLRNGESARGDKNPAWKGGVSTHGGYVMIRMPEHPKAYKNGYIKRAVLVAEEKIGRHLLRSEITHHVNGIKTDDSPENIEVLDARKHNAITAKERWASGNLNAWVLHPKGGNK